MTYLAELDCFHELKNIISFKMNTNRPISLLWVMVIALVSSGVSGMMTSWFFATKQVLTVRSVSLTDDHGRVLAALNAMGGAPEFALFDRRGAKRAAFFLEQNGTPDLYLYDVNGTPRASLDLFDSGVPNMAFAPPGQADYYVSSYSLSGSDFRFSINQIEQGKSHITGTLELSADNGQPQLRIINGQNEVVWQSTTQTKSSKSAHQKRRDVGNTAGEIDLPDCRAERNRASHTGSKQ